MPSLRYIILSFIYIVGYYIISYHSEDDNHAIYHNPYIVLFGCTFIFMYYVKSTENNKCKVNKLENKYIISQSIFYSILALFSHNIYKFLLEKECIKMVNTTINNISEATYVLEGLFVAGIVLLTNYLSYQFYPKCI